MPPVLGWKRWMEIDAEYGAGLLRQGIESCLEADLFVDVDVTTLTHLLSGGMNEVAPFLGAIDRCAQGAPDGRAQTACLA